MLEFLSIIDWMIVMLTFYEHEDFGLIRALSVHFIIFTLNHMLAICNFDAL